MIFKIGEQYFHPKDIACGIIFIDGEERKLAGKLISEIDNYTSDLLLNEDQKKTSCFSCHPGMTQDEFEKWSYPSYEELKKSTKASVITHQL